MSAPVGRIEKQPSQATQGQESSAMEATDAD